MFCLETVCLLWLSAIFEKALYWVVPRRFLFLLLSQFFCGNRVGVPSIGGFVIGDFVDFLLQLIFGCFCGMFSRSSFWFAMWKRKFVICWRYSVFRCEDLLRLLSWITLFMGGELWWGLGPSLDRFEWYAPLQGSFLTRLASVFVSFVFNYISCESPCWVFLDEFDWDGAVGFWLLFLFVIALSFCFKLYLRFNGFVSMSNVGDANF